MKRQNKLNRASALVIAAALAGGVTPAFAGALPQCPESVAPSAAPGDCDLGIRNGDFEHGIKEVSTRRTEYLYMKQVPGWQFRDGMRTLIVEYTGTIFAPTPLRKWSTVLYLKGGEEISQAVRPTRGATDNPTYVVTLGAWSGYGESSSLAVSLVGLDPGKPEREIWSTNITTTDTELEGYTFRVPVTGDVPEWMFIRLESKGSPVTIDGVSLTQTYR